MGFFVESLVNFFALSDDLNRPSNAVRALNRRVWLDEAEKNCQEPSVGTLESSPKELRTLAKVLRSDIASGAIKFA